MYFGTVWSTTLQGSSHASILFLLWLGLLQAKVAKHEVLPQRGVNFQCLGIWRNYFGAAWLFFMALVTAVLRALLEISLVLLFRDFVSNTTYVHWSDPVKTYMSWTPRIWCKKSLDKIEFQQTTSIESRQHRTRHFLLLFAPQPATPKQVNATPTRLKATTRVATSTASEQPSPMAYQTWVVEKHVKFEPLKNIHILGKRSF